MKRRLIVFIIVVLLNSILAQTFYTQTTNNNEYEKIRKKLVKILRRDENGVKVKLINGKNVKGDLTSVDVDSFSLMNYKSKQTQTILLSDVKKVKRYERFTKKDVLWTGAAIGFILLIGTRGIN